MNQSAEERVAQLLAQGHAHRLATQLAIHEAREELAPLRTVAALVGGVARVVSRSSAASGVSRVLNRIGADRHPWATSTLVMVAFRFLRRRPLATLAAAAAGAVAWWMLRPSLRAPAAEPADEAGDAASG